MVAVVGKLQRGCSRELFHLGFVILRTLRQKLGPYGGLIQTVRNVGYRLEEQG